MKKGVFCLLLMVLFAPAGAIAMQAAQDEGASASGASQPSALLSDAMMDLILSDSSLSEFFLGKKDGDSSEAAGASAKEECEENSEEPLGLVGQLFKMFWNPKTPWRKIVAFLRQHQHLINAIDSHGRTILWYLAESLNPKSENNNKGNCREAAAKINDIDVFKPNYNQEDGQGVSPADCLREIVYYPLLNKHDLWKKRKSKT